MGNGTDKKRIAIIAASVLGTALFVVATIALTSKQSDDYLRIVGLSDKSVIDIALQQKGQTRSLALEKVDSVARMTSPDNLPVGDYILTATVNEDGKYKDIRFLINHRSGKIGVVASGFAPNEIFSLKQDKGEQRSGLHFDWSGRIELEQSLTQKNHAPICLETESGFSICHKAGRA